MAGRPSTRPAPRPGDLAGGRPGARPNPGSVPHFGGDHGIGGRPTTLPGRVPGAGGGIAGVRPGGRPGAGGRPGTLPGGRPGTLPGRPDRGQLGDFLGIDGVRPGVQRPPWQTLGPDRVNNIHNNWNVAVGNHVGNFQNWNSLHPDRSNYWRGWGAGVRRGWATTLPAYRPWFNGAWWASHPLAPGWWHYGYLGRPWRYWWTIPTWAGMASWFNFPASSGGYYYDYGSGGNVVYQDDQVLIDGENVASADEFAQSAAELATVEPPADDEAAAAADWMPLGTFGLSTSPDDTELTRILQLAVNQEGIVSGTLYNTKTDRTYTVQGRVDKQTQRVALMLVDRTDVVLETGLYNLTQDEAPALVHYGTEKSESVLLVRLEEPTEDESAPAE